MHGTGTFFDRRFADTAQYPIAAASGSGNTKATPDLITSKLAALHFYEIAIPAPKAPEGSFDKAAAARGKTLFNEKAITIKGVAGINDDFGVASVTGTCTTCHDTANAGNHSVPAPLDIGVADPPVPAQASGNGVQNQFGLPVGDMPVYTLRKKGSNAIKVVTDPGRALITGKWDDVGRFKGPILRGLAGRGPYFHNGAAATLREVVDFYDRRFEIHLSEQEKADLVAFLRAL